ncbi:MAG: TfuA-like protein [Calditrichia bacterium]
MNTSRKPIVFLGPSLPLHKAEKYLDADFRPPAACGDVYMATLEAPDAIGIIDGYFENRPAIWHKEILWALKQGVQVFGAASMGALRAAELHHFGMRGVGEIFRQFATGELEDDDEVAIIHGPAEFKYAGMSMALVDLRSLLKKASAESIISAEIENSLISKAKALHYSQRTKKAILDSVQQVSGDACSRIKSWLESQFQYSQKSIDAIQMLNAMQRPCSMSYQSNIPNFVFHKTDKWYRFTRYFEGRLALTTNELQSGRGTEGFAEAVMLRQMLIEKAERLQLTIPSSKIEEACCLFRTLNNLTSDNMFGIWLKQKGLKPNSFKSIVRDQLLVKNCAKLTTFKLPKHLQALTCLFSEAEKIEKISEQILWPQAKADLKS